MDTEQYRQYSDAHASSKRSVAHLGGHKIQSTRLSTSPSGIGPNVFESRVWYRSSPSIQQCPCGMRTDDS